MAKVEKSARVEFRMPEDLKREVEAAAALLGSSFTAFATQAIVERARAVQRDRQMTELSGDAAQRFAEMIANPPAPSNALRETMRKREIQIDRP